MVTNIKDPPSVRLNRAMNILAKWRTVFAGWQLGTRAKGDPEGDAVRDHREVTMLMRAELSALVQLAIENGVFTTEEWQEQLTHECELLSSAYEQKFPGFRAFEGGIEMRAPEAIETSKGWRP